MTTYHFGTNGDDKHLLPESAFCEATPEQFIEFMKESNWDKYTNLDAVGGYLVSEDYDYCPECVIRSLMCPVMTTEALVDRIDG